MNEDRATRNSINRAKNATDGERRFMAGLERLTRETGIMISGCGCCGSPSLENADDMDADAGYGFGYQGEVTWVGPGDEYDWEHYRESIIRAGQCEQ